MAMFIIGVLTSATLLAGILLVVNVNTKNEATAGRIFVYSLIALAIVLAFFIDGRDLERGVYIGGGQLALFGAPLDALKKLLARLRAACRQGHFFDRESLLEELTELFPTRSHGPAENSLEAVMLGYKPELFPWIEESHARGYLADLFGQCHLERRADQLDPADLYFYMTAETSTFEAELVNMATAMYLLGYYNLSWHLSNEAMNRLMAEAQR